MHASTAQTVITNGQNPIPDALSVLEHAVRTEPSNKECRRRLAEYYLSVMQSYSDALKLYCDLLAADPSDHDALLKIGAICMALGKEADAVHFFQKLLKVDPWNIEAWKHIERVIEKRIEAGSVGTDVSISRQTEKRQLLTKKKSTEAVKAIFEPQGVRLVSIIILTFNQIEYTRKCVASIIKNTPEPHEIIFVDNGSTDGTGAWLKQLIAENRNYRLVENGANRGFAVGNNCGISNARGNFVLLLNNDTVVTEGWLRRLIEASEQDDRIGIVGPRSNNVPGPQRVEGVGYNPETLEGLEDFSERMAERWRGRSMPHWRIVGFCMLIKRKVIERIGGLDPRFAIGNFEDDDYCLRAHLAGFGARIAENCFVHHFGAQTFKGNGLDHSATMDHNWRIFKNKWGLAPETNFRDGYTVAIGQIPFNSEIHCIPVMKTGMGQANNGHAGPCLSSGEGRGLADSGEAAASEPEGAASMPLSRPAQLSSSSEVLYAKASRKAQSGDYEKAILDLEKIVQNDPEYALAHNDLGVLYYSTGKKSRSLRHYELAARLQADNITFQKNLADFYFVEENRAEDALRIYVEVLVKNPSDIDGLLATARICEKVGKVKDARYFYESVLDQDPENREATKWMQSIRDVETNRPSAISFEKLHDEARQHAENGNIQVAIEKLNTLITVQPEHALVFNDLGVLYYSIGDKRSAVACYERAVAIEPANATFTKNLADFYYVEQGRSEDALHLYRNVIDDSVQDIESLIAAGRICVALGLYGEARRHYGRVRAIEPSNEEASRVVTELGEIREPE
jgi:GT2 family glycosyltransferase/Flp pilus assembly protein TadD